MDDDLRLYHTRLPEKGTRDDFKEAISGLYAYWHCAHCKMVYWRGEHCQKCHRRTEHRFQFERVIWQIEAYAKWMYND